MEAAEGGVLLALFKIIGAGIDRVIQFGQTLRRRRQALIRLARRYIQRLGLGQVAGGDGLLQDRYGLDQRTALAAQVHAKLRQRADKGHHRRLGLGLGVRLCRGRDMQGAARVAQQATGNGVVAGQQVGVDHLAQAWGDVFPLFDHQHAVEDFPLHRAVGAVDDAKAGMSCWYRQGVGFAGVAVDGHRDFIVVGLALAGGQLRGVVEQASGGDHHHHRAGHAPAQGAGRRGRLRGWVGQETVLTGWKLKRYWQRAG